MTRPAPSRRTITCPACGGPSIYAADNPFRPFCCERCKNHDLGAWASESYRVEATPPQDGDTNRDDTPEPH